MGRISRIASYLIVSTLIYGTEFHNMVKGQFSKKYFSAALRLLYEVANCVKETVTRPIPAPGRSIPTSRLKRINPRW